MYDPNEAFDFESNDDNADYDPINDDLEFDDDLLDKYTFREVLDMVEDLGNMFGGFISAIDKEPMQMTDWYRNYVNSPRKRVVDMYVSDPEIVENVKYLKKIWDIEDYYAYTKYYEQRGILDEFYKVCDVFGIYDMMKINNVDDILKYKKENNE